MKTEIANLGSDTTAIDKAADLLTAGALVAFPTETVYGLGACAFDPKAVLRIFAVKGRPADNPLIVHVSNLSMAKSLAGEWTVCAETLARAFWPGPLSIVVKAAASVPAEVTAGLDTVAIRMPNHGAALSLIAKTGPIAAPSANASGKPSPVIAAHVMEDLEGRIPLILDGGPCEFGVESTVVDVRGTVPVILRPGAVTIEMIRGVCGGCEIADGVFSPAPERAASPGMLHAHYAPSGRATLIAPHEGMAETLGALFDAAQSQGFCPVILCAGSRASALGSRAMIRLDDDGDMAHGLFRALRHADRAGYDRLFIEGVEIEGTGMAYMNRALRAAGFDMYSGRGRETQ